MNHSFQRARLEATGIGFAGIDGLWWLPAQEAFCLPAELKEELAEIGRALFILFDVVLDAYGTDSGATVGLKRLLNHKVPAYIPRFISDSPVITVRPDFQLVTHSDGSSPYHLVATELEICPSAHGFAHAMQVGYTLVPDLVHNFARYLNGRELLFVGTHRWSEFLFEQLAFCRALADAGGRGRVLYDRPIATLAGEVRRGQRWQPPLFGVHEKTADWNDDILGRIQRHNFQPFVWPGDNRWPDDVGDAAVFRFGYFDCFSPEHLACFARWEARGATLLNPAAFILDSKVVMAAMQLTWVREQIARVDPAALTILDRCIPETVLLEPGQLPRLLSEPADWVVKFAGYDSGDQAWGGRSVQSGAYHTPASWRELLNQYLALPWPVVAQRTVPSLRVDIPYLDPLEQVQLLQNGTTRLRSFLLRHKQIDNGRSGQVMVGGTHITVSGGNGRVSEGTGSVQAPVAFRA